MTPFDEDYLWFLMPDLTQSLFGSACLIMFFAFIGADEIEKCWRDLSGW